MRCAPAVPTRFLVVLWGRWPRRRLFRVVEDASAPKVPLGAESEPKANGWGVWCALVMNSSG